MRRVALALGLTALAACSSGSDDPCAPGVSRGTPCTVPPGGPVVTGPFVNESSIAVFLGSAAPPKDLAFESLTLSENAELLVPEVFGQTPIVDKIPPGGAIALSSQSIIIAATTTEKATTRRATLVSFIGSGMEGRALIIGNSVNGIGRAAIREVDGQLTIVPLDPGMTVHPIRQNAKPTCSDGETKKTLEWNDRAGTATVETQTWSDGCITVTFVGDTRSFRACLPQDAWPFQANRTLTFMPFSNRGALAQTTNSQGERGVTITDGETTLELGTTKAPLSWDIPIAITGYLKVVATKNCLTVDPACSQVTTPISARFVEHGVGRDVTVGVPFEHTFNGELITHRIVGGRVIPVHRMECDGEASGYSLERITLRRKQP